MSGAKIRRLTEGPSGPFLVVGVHHVAMFSAENIRGARRWVLVVQDEDGDWYRRVTPGEHRPLIRIGERMP